MKRLVGGLIIVLIILLYVGYFFVAKDSNYPFADTVLFVIALVGVLVVLASVGIWTALHRILQDDIEKKISQAEQATRAEALSRMAAKVSYAFGEFYEKTKDSVYQDQAIKIYSDALDVLEGRGEIGRDDLKCRIYNNLAFSYAERGQPEDTIAAHFLVNETMRRIKDFPTKETNWLETYAYVLYKLPKKPADKAEALSIINELLQRSDVNNKTKNKLRKRYSISDV